MKTIWVVIADAGRARILSRTDGSQGLAHVQQLENPAGRLHDADLVTDHPGRMEKHGTHARSAMDPTSDPHEQKAIAFARALARLLDSAGARGDYHLLAVIAPAHFLGLLRAELKPATHRRLILSQANDFTRFSDADLELYLEEALRVPAAQASMT